MDMLQGGEVLPTPGADRSYRTTGFHAAAFPTAGDRAAAAAAAAAARWFGKQGIHVTFGKCTELPGHLESLHGRVGFQGLRLQLEQHHFQQKKLDKQEIDNGSHSSCVGAEEVAKHNERHEARQMQLSHASDASEPRK
eukprot:1157607-Pelagomonas_calceolata.AAC.5